jgi:F-type H+-transporting ATPase subunit epsilon
MKLDILTPEKTLFSGEVSSVTLPGTLGVFTLLPDHAPMISSLLSSGKIAYERQGKREELEIGGGFVEVLKNQVTVCTEKPNSNP